MRAAIPVLVLVSILAARAPAQAEFRRLGDLLGGDSYSFAAAISADGVAVAGGADEGGWPLRLNAYRWTDATGMVGLGDLPGAEDQSVAYGISPDGRFVVGSSRTQDDSYWQHHAFLHDGAIMTDLGTLSYVSDGWSYATDVSSGGTHVVGTADHGNGYHTRAFIWTVAGGMSAINPLPGFYSTLGNAISSDGSLVVGQMDGHAFTWTQATGLVDIGGRTAHGISPDGTMILGVSNGNAAHWTEGDGWVELPWGAWGDDQGAYATSSDHGVFVGYDGYHGYYWTPEGGARWIEDVLADEYGVDLGDWRPFLLTGLSDDGTVIAGSALQVSNPTNFEGFRAVVPRTRFTRLGSALAGSGGVEPQLYGRGDLAPGGHAFFAVEDAPRNALTFFIIGATRIDAPLFTGTLVPYPDLIVVAGADYYGKVTIGGGLPPALPSGIDLYVQAWIVDPGAPKGFSATNAVKGVTQ